jgi:hypothetical protein
MKFTGGKRVLPELQIGSTYRIYHVDWGSDDYGQWEFTGADNGLLWFINGQGAHLSIPKATGEFAPALSWVLQKVNVDGDDAN